MPDHKLHYSMDMVAPGISATAVLADAHFWQLHCRSEQTMTQRFLTPQPLQCWQVPAPSCCCAACVGPITRGSLTPQRLQHGQMPTSAAVVRIASSDHEQGGSWDVNHCRILRCPDLAAVLHVIWTMDTGDLDFSSSAATADAHTRLLP